jgi:isopentenyldiphosphate isomerase
VVELVDVLNEENEVIDTLPRNVVNERNLRHNCVYVIVLNKRGEWLVTKRTAAKKVYPSLYEIARGGTCASGESFEDCARRELEEEVGVRVGKGGAKLEFLFDFDFKDDFINERVRVFKTVFDGKPKLQKEEVAESFFVSEEKLREMARARPSDFCPDGFPVLAALEKI